MSKQQIGVVGMAVMGRNLALNIESRGYTVSVFNRSRDKTEEVIAENPGKKLVPYYTVKEFVESLETPRRILLMVKAGAGTDAAIDSLKPYLEKGDIIIDGGNTFFQDTIRRNRELSAEGFNFIGTGVSGGEEGAKRPIHHAWRSERCLRTGRTDPDQNCSRCRRWRALCDLYRC
jgi:6-phosphogluconate dehydrogenase